MTRQVRVGLVLELTGGLKANKHRREEAGRDRRVLPDLYDMFGQRTETRRVAVEGSTKQRLAQTADRVLGPGTVRQVLILNLLERPVQP